MTARILRALVTLVWVSAAILLVACGGLETEVAEETAATTAPTATIEPTTTTAPTETPVPTATDVPTETPIPTATEVPTETATSEPEETRPPTRPPNPTATPDEAPAEENETPPADDESEDAGGGGLDGQALVDKANEEMARAPSYRSQFTYDVTSVIVDASETITLTQSIEGDCLQESARRAYCSTLYTIDLGGFPITQTLEYIQDGDQYWVREEGQKWEEAPAGEVSQLTPNIGYDGIVEDAEVIGETEIDGRPVYEVQLTVDPDRFLEDTLGENPGEIAFSDLEFVVREWIGQEDFLLYKTRIDFSATGEQDGQSVRLSFQINLNNTDFGEPVEIPDPTAG